MRTILVIGALGLAGCGGAAATSPSDLPAPAPMTKAEANPAPPAASAALNHIAYTKATRTRVSFVGPDAPARIADLMGPPTAVQDVAPARTVLADAAISAAQACLGNTIAQTILGPGRVGADAAIGVGLVPAEGGGRAVRICGVPHFRRHLDSISAGIRARFGRPAHAAEVIERDIVTADVPVTDASLRLLAGGHWLDRLFTS